MIATSCFAYSSKALRVGAFVLALGLLVCPLPANAEPEIVEVTEEVYATPIDGEGDHAVPAEHAESHESGGLPQLNFTWYPTQMFWVIIFFGLLLGIFSRKILPDISRSIETRREHIQSDLDNAENLKDNAENARKTYEELLKDANQKAMSLMQKADESLKDKAAKTVAEFQEKSMEMLRETEKDIEKTKAVVMEDMHDVAAEVASMAASKIMGVPADIKQAKNIINNLYKKAA